MTTSTARIQSLQLLNALPDSKMPRVLLFLQELSKTKKTARKKSDKQQALEDLFAMWKPAEKEISLNGTKEVADILLSRYEKSFS